MKKILLILISTFFFFMFIPNALAAEDLEQDCLTSSDETCRSLMIGNAKFNENDKKYDSYFRGIRKPGHWIEFGYDEKFHNPSYTYLLGTGGFLDDTSSSKLMTYKLTSKLPYKLTYTFFLSKDVKPDDFDVNFNQSDFKFTYNAKAKKIDGDFVYDDEVFKKFFVNSTYNITEENRLFTISFNFIPKDNYEEFGFYIGMLNFEDVPEDFSDFLGNHSNVETPIQLVDVKLYQTDDFDDDGVDIIDIDKETEKDSAIFGDLKQCEPLDIGCHVDNIFTMIKKLFVRIGNFFNAILEFLLKIPEMIIDLLSFLFVPESEDIQSLFDTLNTFLTNKLGFLMFPFDFIMGVLNRFLDLPNIPQPIISIPNISLGNFGTLIHGFSFDISEYWNKAPFKQFYDIYLIFVHAFIGFGLYKLSLHKFNQIVGGGRE